MNVFGWKKYILVLIITCSIFGMSMLASAYFNRQKIAEIRDMQNKISIDILSSETQFSLLEEASCTDINNSALTEEIATLASKLAYTEQNVNAKDEIAILKNQYTILEVKDFLLNKRIADRCKTKVATILYFYTDKDQCEDCVKQSYVLDAIRAEFKDVRVYSFDYGLDLSTIKALRGIYKITEPLPALVIDGKTYQGFQNIETIRAIFNEKAAQKTPIKSSSR